MVSPLDFREALGRYPTGVTVITSQAPEGAPVGMVIGTFTSVSLDPALVGFLPMKNSSSIGAIRESGRFCVNVLSEHQEQLARDISRPPAQRFEGVSWQSSETGGPRIEGAVAWIDCSIESIQDAGDHYFVLGRVEGLELGAPNLPLLFFRGGYGRFTPQSYVAASANLVSHVSLAQMARAELESLAADLQMEAVATVRQDEWIVPVAVASYEGISSVATVIGRGLPIAPPLGKLFVAWAGIGAMSDWLKLSPTVIAREDRSKFEDALAVVRDRGWAVTLRDTNFMSVMERIDNLLGGEAIPEAVHDVRGAIARVAPDYDVSPIDPDGMYDLLQLAAPVFDADGNVAMALTVLSPGLRVSGSRIQEIASRLTDGANRVSQIARERSAAVAG